jgi:hypothetical protein
VNRSGETLQGIVGSVKRVTDIVGEIAAASGEQSTGIEQVNTAMTQMDLVTQSNSAQTEELSATAQALSEQAAHLMELVSSKARTPECASELAASPTGKMAPWPGAGWPRPSFERKRTSAGSWGIEKSGPWRQFCVNRSALLKRQWRSNITCAHVVRIASVVEPDKAPWPLFGNNTELIVQFIQHWSKSEKHCLLTSPKFQIGRTPGT